MKHVEVGALVSAVPIVEQMTRNEKLSRLARLVGTFPGQVVLLHGLEHARPSQLEEIKVKDIDVWCAFALAAGDPDFQKQGLTMESSVGDALRFFEITQQDAHPFACDCGGHLSNHTQAALIAGLVR